MIDPSPASWNIEQFSRRKEKKEKKKKSKRNESGKIENKLSNEEEGKWQLLPEKKQPGISKRKREIELTNLHALIEMFPNFPICSSFKSRYMYKDRSTQVHAEHDQPRWEIYMSLGPLECIYLSIYYVSVHTFILYYTYYSVCVCVFYWRVLRFDYD